MIHLELPIALAAVLAGLGVYGILARRNAVLVLIGIELLLNAANLLLVTAGSRPGTVFAAGAVVTLFVITIAAAEISIALAVILVMFRRHGHIDLTAVPELEDDAGDLPDGEPAEPRSQADSHTQPDVRADLDELTDAELTDAELKKVDQ